MHIVLFLLLALKNPCHRQPNNNKRKKIATQAQQKKGIINQKEKVKTILHDFLFANNMGKQWLDYKVATEGLRLIVIV